MTEPFSATQSIAQSWLSVTQTTLSISFWKESISSILKELSELEEGVKAKF